MYLFDFDGTLIDSNGIWEEIDVDFLSARDISPVPEDYTEYVSHHGFHQSAIYTKERYGLEESVEEIKEIWREMGRSAYGESLPLKEGALALLQRLHEAGEDVVLLTSCMPELCELAMTRHGLYPYFKAVYTAAELGLQKREPEIYQKVATLCGVTTSDIIFFDDSPTYCAAAQRAGMRVVGVYDAFFASYEMEMRASCDQYVASLADYMI